MSYPVMDAPSLWKPVSQEPPWGWNPAATFLTAYKTMQEENRAKQEFEMKSDLDRILFPVKKAQAEFSLKQLALESQLLQKNFQAKSAAIDRSMQIVNSAGSGASSNVAGNVGSSNQAPAQDEDPTSFNLSGTIYERKPAAQPQTGSQPVAKKPVVDLTSVK